MKNPFKKKHVSFHERHPEILEWEIGDEILIKSNMWETFPYGGNFTYKGISSDESSIIVAGGDVLYYCNIKRCINYSQRNRKLKMELESSYNQYLLDIQSAVKQLSHKSNNQG